MKPRLREVAKRAGVSEATVSRVVNGKPGVAEATRREVLRALGELGYEPVGVPVVSAARWRGTAGLIVPELDNPVFPAFAQAIEARLAKAGLLTVLCSATEEGTAEDDYVAMLLDHGVAGIVFVSGHHADATADHSTYRRLVAKNLPIVLVNGVVPGLDVPYVSCDEAVAAELGVRHLVDLGHQRIGLAAGSHRYQPARRRLEGYLRAMERTFGEAPTEFVVECAYTVEGGQLAAVQLLELGCTAIMSASDMMALGVVRAVRERGLDVPADVSVVGYDDTKLVGFADPPLTTLRQPVRAMGGAAANALVQQLSGGQSAHRGEYVFRPELIVRGSTSPRQDRVRPASP